MRDPIHRGGALRAATESDLAGVASIEGEAFEAPWDAASLRLWLAPGRGLLLVEETAGGESLAGYALFQLAPGQAELLRIGTTRGQRRTGVARRLLAAGLERLERDGHPVVTLEVRADNVPAISLYSSFSFVRVGVRPAYYSDGSDALVYRREAGRKGPESVASPSG